MEGWTANSFGELNADGYDALNDPGTTAESVELIADIAGTDRVLELAVGTGRIALPLAERGVDVTGLEVSPEMVAGLRAKPGGADLPVVLGDMEEVAVDGTFDLVILVFNTLFNLPSQEAQVNCFRNTAARLAPGGRFLIETFVPDLTGFRGNQDVKLKHMSLDHLSLDVVRHDQVRQLLEHQRLHVRDGRADLIPLVMRYAFPAELDLMARLAGMELEHRWGGWHRQPFTRESRMHVSVWRKPE
ncbi:class I SAM-dependent methyltransferase [Pseudoruegeria sp. HB172150]|uniref:class I SAM-dependent methyltransferase n=1 Tax=Pseudoruegeria sp. HB172150 TaxID=2721164 RepID=UPI0015541360|nr:class I SAM-dependent methyltransferase [Pseudoruegeria sp. HB172150]